MDTHLVAKAAMLAPDEVLRALAAASDGIDPDQRPLDQRPVVRLHLAAGHVAEGWLIGVGGTRSGEVVVLACPDHSGQPPRELVYLRIREVVSVGVREPERYRDVLSRGALPAPPPVDGPPITRLALRREFAPTAELPLQLAWDELPGSEDATANLATLLRSLRLAVSQTRRDELGQRAWDGIAAVRVEHRPGEGLAVLRIPDALLVTADLTAALPRRLEVQLESGISAVL
ncbi:MAG: hypothetical protein J2P15_12960 [Micromonosporaceae bacterium]|nr:hypothetical protein [Micromonosporaceae bacterium]